MRGNGKVNAAASAGAGVCVALTVGALSLGAMPAGAATHLAATHPAAKHSAAKHSAAKHQAGTAGPTERVIVLLRNQWAGSGRPAPSSLIRAAQAPYLKRLSELGATGMHGYVLVNAIAARVPTAALTALAAAAGVAWVFPDSPIKGPSPAQPPGGTAAVSATYPGTGAQNTAMRTPAGACSATPQLEPEGLTITRTDSAEPGFRTARSLGYTGAGVKVAFLADGIDTDNSNLVRDHKPVISDYKDFSGDGTAAATAGGTAFTDASALAGQGSQVFNVANFGAQTPASAASHVPVTFDFGPFPGDPDQAAGVAIRVTAAYPLGTALTPVTQGLWYAAPAEAGPFTGTGAVTTTVSASMNAVTQQFDTTASPSTGDFWRFAVGPLAPTASYNLFVINPGQTKTVSLTVKPTGAPGTVVRGMLYIDDFADSLQFLSGSQLIALPYAYTVK